MRIVALAVLAMISVSCKSTSGGHYEMRAAAFVVPTFDEDEEQEDGDDSAYLKVDDCDLKDGNAGECVQRARSAKVISTPAESKAAR